MKNYRLAVDENGSPFVLNSKGSIDFGYITEEMNLQMLPVITLDYPFMSANISKNIQNQCISSSSFVVSMSPIRSLPTISPVEQSMRTVVGRPSAIYAFHSGEYSSPLTLIHP